MKPVKNFMDCWDYSTEELLALADLIRRLKKDAYEGTVPKLLKGQSLAMIFNGNSTRTRVSFEVAAQQLGAHALFLTGGPEGELHLGKRETIGDTARVISSMVDGIAMRWRNTKEMEEFAAYRFSMEWTTPVTPHRLCAILSLFWSICPKAKH